MQTYFIISMIFFLKGEANKRPRRACADENDTSNDSGTVV